MDINQKITNIEAELVELKEQLKTSTGDRDREREIALRAEITATKNTLAKYIDQQNILLTGTGKNFAFLNRH